MNRLLLVMLSVLAFCLPGDAGAQQPAAKPDDAGAQQAAAKPGEAKPQSLDELLLFFPSRYPQGDWSPKDLRFEDVWFTAEDKTRLHGWYCPNDNPRAIILLAHGNAGHVASRARWLRYLQSEARVTVFIFDYRGYGRSEGTPTVEGALQDAAAARAKLRELAGIKDSEMVLMGESLGGAIVVHLAAESAPRALVLQSTFASLRDVADFHYPRLSWLVPKDKLNSAALIGRYQGPVLLSHGQRDRTIPFSSGYALFRAANEPKTLVSLAYADHNNALTDEYLEKLDAFLENLPGAPEPPSRQQPSWETPRREERPQSNIPGSSVTAIRSR